jgi:hypothetical protein
MEYTILYFIINPLKLNKMENKKEETVTEMCNRFKEEMMLKLEQQKQAYIIAYQKTYGEMPKCYADEK